MMPESLLAGLAIGLCVAAIAVDSTMRRAMLHRAARRIVIVKRTFSPTDLEIVPIGKLGAAFPESAENTRHALQRSAQTVRL